MAERPLKEWLENQIRVREKFVLVLLSDNYFNRANVADSDVRFEVDLLMQQENEFQERILCALLDDALKPEWVATESVIRRFASHRVYFADSIDTIQGMVGHIAMKSTLHKATYIA